MSESPASTGGRRALVIASQIGGLRGCHHDAELAADLLTERGFDVVSMREAKATRAGILGAYEELIQATEPGDAAVVYYAGHGSRSTTTRAGIPGELRFIMPTDITQTNADDFRGILTEELSVLQWRLTRRTPNVTTILDCCYSARMARDEAAGGMQVRGWDADWPVDAVVHRWVTAAAEFRRLREAHPDPRWFDANPRAVRLVACGSHQQAYEGHSVEFGRCHGYFTAALVPVLRADPHITWQVAADRVRHRVLVVTPIQRPEGEGPTDRIAFTVDVRRAGQAHPVRLDLNTGQAWLDGARIHGIGVGDEFLFSGVGLFPDVSVAPVMRVTHLLAGAALLDSMDGRPIPDGSVAHPWRSADSDLGVRITTTDGTPADAILAGLADLPGIHVRSADGDRPWQHYHAERAAADVATVTVTGARYMLRDGAGLALYRAERVADPSGIAQLRRHVQDLANSLRLRSLSGRLRKSVGG